MKPSSRISDKKDDGLPSPFKSMLPASLRISKDKLKLRLDFYGESIVLQDFGDKATSYRMVSAQELAHAVSSELTFGSGLLPDNALWWTNDSEGPMVAVWMPPGMRRLALQTKVDKPPERYNVPLPGLIFLCRPGQPPVVFAASERPKAPKDRVFKAPLCNVYDNGHTCGGNNRFPANIAEIPESFLRSFFTPHANIWGRSKAHDKDVTLMWKSLDKAKATEYPLSDLVYHGTVADLMATRW